MQVENNLKYVLTEQGFPCKPEEQLGSFIWKKFKFKFIKNLLLESENSGGLRADVQKLI